MFKYICILSSFLLSLLCYAKEYEFYEIKSIIGGDVLSTYSSDNGEIIGINAEYGDSFVWRRSTNKNEKLLPHPDYRWKDIQSQFITDVSPQGDRLLTSIAIFGFVKSFLYKDGKYFGLETNLNNITNNEYLDVIKKTKWDRDYKFRFSKDGEYISGIKLGVKDGTQISSPVYFNKNMEGQFLSYNNLNAIPSIETIVDIYMQNSSTTILNNIYDKNQCANSIILNIQENKAQILPNLAEKRENSDCSYSKAYGEKILPLYVLGASINDEGISEAVLWENNTIIPLGTLGLFESLAGDITSDGEVIIGSAKNQSYQPNMRAREKSLINVPLYWQRGKGSYDFNEIIKYNKIKTKNFKFLLINSISDDGKSLTGIGLNRKQNIVGWALYLNNRLEIPKKDK